MSHFAGLVVLTPDYLKNHSVDGSLAKYDEQLEVEEYSRGEVDDFEKIQFIEYYSKNMINKNLKEMLYENLVKSGEIEVYDPLKHNYEKERYLYITMSDHKAEYVELFKKNYPNLFDNFSSLYAKKGEDWNGGNWRINHLTGNWEEYSTYNPNSVFDWYAYGGRWDSSIKTKTDEYVNECLLEEIDWTDFKPEDYEEEEKEDFWGKKYHPLKENVKWHFTENNPPYCLFVDGCHYSIGDMGWFGCSSNEKDENVWSKEVQNILSKLPRNSEVYLLDFHI